MLGFDSTTDIVVKLEHFFDGYFFFAYSLEILIMVMACSTDEVNSFSFGESFFINCNVLLFKTYFELKVPKEREDNILSSSGLKIISFFIRDSTTSKFLKLRR